MAGFATDYETKVAPILKKHGLTPSSEQGRATPDSIFSRPFEVRSFSEVAEMERTLLQDARLEEALRDAGAGFLRTLEGKPFRLKFEGYAAPAGPGRVVPAGPGRVVPAGPGRGHWRTYAVADGLPDMGIQSICRDREGNLWFGTGRGVSRYDGRSWTTFTTRDGLADNLVRAVFQDREGNLWFGTRRGGVSRYDREGRGSSRPSGRGTFTTFTSRDGLGEDQVWSILQDRDGVLWFGNEGGRVTRYDGKTWTVFTPEDGLSPYVVWPMAQDREGRLYFGTGGGGVSRYDPSTLRSFDKLRTQGSGQGGKTFTTLTTQDGLAHNDILSIFLDREGDLWFGTYGGGVSQYDGRSFTTLTTKDGLAYNVVRSVFQDRDGNFWFGTFGGGVTRYDPSTSSGHGGRVFLTLTAQDGLGHNMVTSILQDREGDLWFGTEVGVTRYRPPPPSPPPVFIDAVVADRRHEGVSEVSVPSTERLVAFEFHGMSFKTRPEQMVYRYRLRGYDQDWRTTHDRRVEYQNLPRGAYTFEAQAVDRDLVYSDPPATVTLTVHLPYDRIGWMSALGVALALVAWQAGRIVRRDLQLRQSEERLRTVVTGAPVVLWALDRDGVFTFAQGQGLDALGLRPGQVVGQSAFEMYRDAPRILENLRRALAGETFTSVVAVAGRVFDSRYSPVRDERGEVIGVIGVSTDITERRRAEEERARLDEQLQHLRHLYRLRSALGTARSPEEVIQRAGEALMETLAPVTGVGVVIQHDGRAWQFGETDNCGLRIADCGMNNPKASNSEIRNPKSEMGGVRYERGLVWGERERGRLVLFSGVELSESEERALLDETAGQIGRALEARELEAQLLQSARLVSLGQMAAGVAHEINQPLTVISTTAGDIYYRLVEDLNLPPEQLKKMMQDVLEVVERMDETVGHLRVFSRDTSQEPGAPFSVNEVIHASLKLIGQQLQNHGIALDLRLDEGLPPVMGRPHQMEQVFLNLIGNARDALDEKETGDGRQETGDRGLSLDTPRLSRVAAEEPRIEGQEVEGAWEKRMWVRTRQETEGGRWVVVEVEDNGVGIDQADVRRVFEPFFTTKPADRGTGLGLSISYAIVKNHGGEVACESRKGEGTVFRVRLPVVED